ncbi:MAG TPA: amino acid adenylation domain-containing protein [Thermoanaerobaculia bacterium]|nr:amino acid adenylation domain-containing protein [Thermoanaerobaculia bacterium]
MTLIDALQRQAGSDKGIRFIERGNDETFVAYGELYDRALRTLCAMQDAGVREGDAALIVARRNEPLLTFFWACVLGRITAVPLLYPANDDHVRRIHNVAARVGNPWVLTDMWSVPTESPLFLRTLNVLPAQTASTPERVSLHDLSHVQFSSGSTGTPKGVRITHANVLANVEAIVRRGGFDANDVFASWMPLTHDFGLVWFHLMPLLLGANQCLMPTQLFVRNPLAWMDVVTRHRATITGAPSSAYARLCEAYDANAAAKWDLSSIRFLGNGAEPISPRVARETTALLGKHGLAPGMMNMGYGLAEATLIVSFTSPGELMRTHFLDRLELVDCGAPLDNLEVRVGDAGRIFVRGASITDGYLNDPEATAALLDREGWLDTGDLGYLDQGRIVVTGRAKELIILNGVNYYPHDVEEAVGEGLDGVAACGIPARDGRGEELVLFVQFRDELETFLPLARRVREAVVRHMGVAASRVVPVRRIPHTTSGKVQRVDLARRYAEGEFDEVLAQLDALTAARSRSMRGEKRKARELVLGEARALTGEDIATDRPLFEQGFTSMRLVELLARLNETFGTQHPINFIFDHPTVDDLAAALTAGAPKPRATKPRSNLSEPVAIIGMACRFPGGATTPSALWQLLIDGHDTVSPVPSERWPGSEFRGSFLEDVDHFDARFFGLLPVEAKSADPQQLMLLETSWEALEDAGLDVRRLKGSRGGVFVGICNNDYAQVEARSTDIGPYAFTGTAYSVAAGRLAYVYGLHGPTLAVDTACSSSLVAVHLAVQSLRTGESEIALAAGVNLILSPEVHIGLSRMNALSADGRCKTFDQSADGYGRGEGCGVVVLKRLADAERDGDRVLAVIAGTAINHDGASNGLTVPNSDAQQAVIRAALDDAGLSPADVDYVEAHGTGTSLGDPIEVQALASVFAERTEPLLIGSLKSNIAHTEAAAGIAGLIKCVLAMNHRSIPATIHVREKNRAIAWSSIPVAVVDRNLDRAIQHAGVSSFGLSGTNAHVLLSAPPARTGRRERRGEGPLLLSSRSESSLRTLASHVTADLAPALARRRTPLPLRMAITGTHRTPVIHAQADPGVVFVFPGQGSLKREAIQHLIDTEPVFARALQLTDFDDLTETKNAQPAIVAVQLALTELWRSRGVTPCAVIGHSIGEYAAAVAAGVMAPDDAMRLATMRGRLMQALPRGRMLAVDASAERMTHLLRQLPGGGAEVAALNAPERVTISGTPEAIEEVIQACRTEGIRATELAVSHAFHSAMMDPVLDDIGLAASAIRFAPPVVPFISTVTGTAIANFDAHYWTAHVRQPVLFEQGIRALEGERLFLEIGTSSALSSLGAQILPDAHWLPSSRPETLGELWCHGVEIDWSAIYPDRAWDVDLPPYPWDREHVRRTRQVAKPHTAPVAEPVSADSVNTIIAKAAGLDPSSIDPDQTLLSLGLDSLMLVRVRQSIERDFGIDIELRDFYERFDTPAKIAAHVQPASRRALPARSADVRPARSTGSRNNPRPDAGAPEIKGLYKKLDTAAHAERPAHQRAHLARLMAEYTTKTRGSKRQTAAARAHFANSRSIIGFRREWKEMIYPLTVARADGAKVWDVDGNEYVDVTMGFGALMFGHAPRFIREALHAETDRGFALGPTRPLAAEAAERIHRLTGVERVSFFTTGTEAVMVAARVARAVTGRNRIAVFTNSYHGSFDAFLATGWADEDGATTLPIAAGTPESLVQDTIVLKYGDPKSLDLIRNYSSELALVLVEPVQSRDPVVQPCEFLHELRAITRDASIALLFDEMITGFRCHPRGAQEWFGVDADLVTYGKVVGGGMPIGVLAGSRRFMDAVDGGHWTYGNDSVPENYTAFVAGTYNGHALSMAAANAVLAKLEEEGPALQQQLNERTAAFAAELNAFFEAVDVPIRVVHFSSLFRFVMSGDAELLNYHLLNHGVFVWEGRNCFLSLAHTDADIARIVEAVKQSVYAMLDDGWLTSSTYSLSPRVQRIPLSESQKEMWFLVASDPIAAGAYRETLALTMRGTIDAGRLQHSLNRVVERHASLRTIAFDEHAQTIAPSLDIILNAADFDAPFDLTRGPFLRARFENETLTIAAHHLIADGWSLGLIAQELLEIYAGREATLPSPHDIAEYVVFESSRFPSAPPSPSLPSAPLQLPSPSESLQPPSPFTPLQLGPSSSRGARLHIAHADALVREVQRFARERNVTAVTTFFAAYAALVAKLANAHDFVIGMPYAGQLEMNAECLTGQCSKLLAVPVHVDPSQPFATLLERMRVALLETFADTSRDIAHLPRINVLFNMDRPVSLTLPGVEIELPALTIEQTKFDLFLNIQELNGHSYFDVDFNANLGEANVARWIERLFAMIHAATARPDTTIAALTGDVDPIQHDARRDAEIVPYVAPRNETESALCRIWASALNVPRVGITDRFPDLGGHSLKAIRIAARIERELGIHYRLRDLFERPTIAELAELAALRRRAFARIPRLADATHYPVSNAQLRLWTLDQLEPGLAAYNIPFAIGFEGNVDRDALRHALDLLTQRHETLRTRILDLDGVPHQVVDPQRSVELHTTAAHLDDLDELLARPFDLARGPLWRADLIRNGKTWLVLNLHHSISDVWSLGIFARELLTLYRDPRTPLPPLPVQYRDFAAWQKTSHDDADAQYWRTQLAEPRASVTYPPDFARPAVKTYNGASIRFDIDAAPVNRFCRERGVSLFVLFAAAMTRQLHELTGERDVVLGSVIAGRDHPDVEGLIGFFVNNLALRTRIEHDEPFEALLERVRETALDAFEHSARPWDEIVDLLRVPRDPSRNAVFDVVLVMDDRGDADSLARTFQVEFEELDTPTSQFDLTLYVTDGPDKIRCNAVFNTDLYRAETVERWMRSLSLSLSWHQRGEGLTGEVRTLTPSYHQDRLWFVDRFETGYLYPAQPTYYNMPHIVRFDGPIDAARLQRAVDRVAHKYESLRMRFAPGSDRPAVILHNDTPRVTFVDDLQSRIDVPFDLAHHVLWRVEVHDQDVLLLAHHSIADAVSLRTIARDLMRSYAGEEIGNEVLPFSEVARRQKDARELAIEADLPYWRRALENLTALELPTDRPRAAIHVYKAASEPFTFDRVSDEAVHLALFHALLQRYSDQRDIVTGVLDRLPFDAVGPLTEYIVVRSNFDDAPSLRTLARRLEEQLQHARAHHNIAFDELVLQLKPKNDMSRTALFDVLFHHGDGDALNRGWGKFDLNWGSNAVTYNAELFDRETITRMLYHFEHLAMNALAHPDEPLTHIPLAEEEVDPEVISDYPYDTTLHQIFEARAEETPHAIAMTHGDRTITYEEVNERANALAHALRESGVRRDSLVGVYLDRSFDLVIAFLGILKAGGAYVPLDPEYPRLRTEFVIEDSRMQWIVTTRSLSVPGSPLSAPPRDPSQTTDPQPPTTVHIEDLGRTRHAPQNITRPEDLAYVIYTSGSTGKPKGVLIEHRNVVALMLHRDTPFDFHPGDVWTLFHSPCFDFSVWEMYGALLFGGRLVVIPREVARDTRAFRELLVREGVTVLNQTPAAFYALVAEDDEHPPANLRLRYVIFGGEKLLPSKLQGWNARYPDCALINMYGITETTVHVTFKALTSQDLASSTSVIGRALPNVSTYVVDSRLRPQPPGVPGELLVGGHGVARGYLHRPELTMQRFLPNPFGTGRLYRSGDLGRLRANGELIYHGRIDQQVKIRGFRIELGEVEAGLLAHDAVREAVVTTGDDGTGTAQLHAYLVLARAVSLDEMQSFLREHLPEQMIPSRFFAIGRVPMTENGKVDRTALHGEELTTGSSFIAPRTHVESVLASIWSEVLRRDRVSLGDNFFEIGGHSLKAAQAVSRIRQRLGRDVTLKDFFTAPTLGALAEIASSRERLAATAIAPAGEADTHPLSYAQRRLWLHHEVNPRSFAYNMVGDFALTGDVSASGLEAAFGSLIARHESLRTRFVRVKGEPRQVVDTNVAFALGRHDLRDAPDPEAALSSAIARELEHVFDLARGPLVRAALLRLRDAEDGAPRHVLLVNLHHIVADGWSVAVLVRELVALYDAHERGATPELPPLPIQYKDFASWQLAQSRGEAATRHRDYWLSQFAEGVPTLEIAADRPRPTHLSGRGAMIVRTFDAQLSEALRTLAREQQTTLFAVTTAVLTLLLAQRSGQRDVVVGTPIAGRNHVDLEAQVGFYLNLLPLRTRVDRTESVRALVRSATETIAGAFEHQDYPFDLLVENLGGARDASHHPLFDVLHILQNNERMRMDLRGVRIEERPDRSASAKYDLNFMIEDRPLLELKLEYSSDLFDRATAASLADDYLRIAQAMTSRPDAAVGELVASASHERDAFLASTMDVGLAGAEGW